MCQMYTGPVIQVSINSVTVQAVYLVPSKDLKSICFIWRLNVLISVTQTSDIQI